MKTIIYARTSTEEQNPENQLSDCITINVYGDYTYLEDKSSAWKETERPNFEILKKEIMGRKVKHLIVWDLDRLYRNRKRLISFFQLCKNYGCEIHSFRQQWLESINSIQPPFNEIMFNLMLEVMGWLAEEESTKKSERVKLAVRKRGDKTYSYKGNKWGRKALSTQKRNKIKELYETKKYTLREISQQSGVSLGAVHKTIRDIMREITINKDVQILTKK